MSYLGSEINTEDYSDSNDVKISELDYGNPATASYIIDRKSSTFHSTGGNIYSPSSGGTLVRFNIESPSDWLDPSSVRVQFNVRNNGGFTAASKNEQLFMTGGAHSFFRRLRVLSRGIVIHDITEYNRVHEMFSYFKSPAVTENELSESIMIKDSFGSHYQPDIISGFASQGTTTGINAGQYQTVMFKPFCGILMQEKYLPLKYCPLSFELEVVSDAKEPIVEKGAKDYAAGFYTAALVSESWQLENFRVRCDLLKLDNSLQNEFDNKLLGDAKNRLSIRFMNHNSQQFKINGNDMNINMTRALSNLNRVFVTFLKDSGLSRFWSKKYNTFYSTLAELNNEDITTFDQAWTRGAYSQIKDPVVNTQLQIGGKLFPEYPIQSSQEAYYMLRKSINDDKIFNKHIHSVNIHSKDYLSSKFICVFDVCRVNCGTASYAGLDVRNGSNINLRFKMPEIINVTWPNEIHTVLESEATLRILGSFIYMDE
jgi:hypothetical protein